MSDYQIETKCIQSGWQPENGGPRMLPIYQSTTFKYDTSEHMESSLTWRKRDIFIPGSRIQPTTLWRPRSRILRAAWRPCLPRLGRRPIFTRCSIFVRRGACDLRFLHLRRYFQSPIRISIYHEEAGIECTFVDVDAPEEELAKAFKPNTRAVLAESIANPALVILDIEKMARLAHSHGVPLIVDNTFATPVNCRPFEWGADIVTHSTTKYMDGHAMQVGGAIVDSGNFDWEAYGDKFHGLTTPDDSYHGLYILRNSGKKHILPRPLPS